MMDSPTDKPHNSTLRTDIREIESVEVPLAVDILAEGMRGNPLHIEAFGAELAPRQRRLRNFLGHLAGYVHTHGVLLGAFSEGELVGVLGMMKPGHCRPKWHDVVRLARVIVASNPPWGSLRIFRWLLAWRRRDAAAPHWHIGPLAVRPTYRRRGVGRNLMAHCCRDMDARAATAFLETDLAINVAFYETLGFVVVWRESVLGVTNWFMSRSSPDGYQRPTQDQKQMLPVVVKSPRIWLSLPPLRRARNSETQNASVTPAVGPLNRRSRPPR